MSGERAGDLAAKLLAKLGKVSPEQQGPLLENNECGGALLYVTRAEAIAMAGSGRYLWVLDPIRIPEEGRHSWRISCRRDVMIARRRAELPPDATEEQRRNAPTYTVKYGLCAACNGMELAMRKHLKKKADEAAEQAKKTPSRKRGFREEADE